MKRRRSPPVMPEGSIVRVVPCLCFVWGVQWSSCTRFFSLWPGSNQCLFCGHMTGCHQ